MTSPIAFTSIPVPARQARTVTPTPSAAQAAAIDANFAMFNSHQQNAPTLSAGARSKTAGATTSYPGGVIGTYATLWPACSLYVPNCDALLVYISGTVATLNQGYMTLQAYLTGNGVVGDIVPTFVAFNSASWSAGGASAIVGRNQLVPGGRIDLYAQWLLQTEGTYYLSTCEMGMIPLG